jgi:hypothetical protein
VQSVTRLLIGSQEATAPLLSYEAEVLCKGKVANCSPQYTPEPKHTLPPLKQFFSTATEPIPSYSKFRLIFGQNGMSSAPWPLNSS